MFERIDSNFYSSGTKCAGWLYLPTKVQKPPIIVMAHGFAAERTFALPKFAERFAKNNFAVFLFDYRYFGDSDGEPRNRVNPKKQLEDWSGAISHVRTITEINSDRIAMWGSSFSGGHVIVTAAKDPKIRAIVAQVPFVCGMSTVFRISTSGGINSAFSYTIKSISSIIRDLYSTYVLKKPYYVPVVGDPNTFAVMNTPESKQGYLELVPEDSKWENKCTAKDLIFVMFYRPLNYASKVKAPALIIMGEEDSLISPKTLEKCVSKMKNAQLLRLPTNHFSVYKGELFEKIVEEEINFFKKNL